jgi:hypothetical protein
MIVLLTFFILVLLLGDSLKTIGQGLAFHERVASFVIQ